MGGCLRRLGVGLTSTFAEPWSPSSLDFAQGMAVELDWVTIPSSA